MIYGTVILAACMLLGRWMGAILAGLIGVDGDVGGVGFAMLALMLTMSVMRRARLVSPSFEAGIGYWAGVYIPIVVAMAATQNVMGAVRGGPLAVAAGIAAAAAGFSAVPFLAGRPATVRARSPE